jgi:hypothetical protein
MERRRGKKEDLQFSEVVSSLSAYNHHSECSLWEHKSVKMKKQKHKDS